eukprot:COSAG06_NODE_3603_length_5131_cov_5.927862_7_plen_96_part_00
MMIVFRMIGTCKRERRFRTAYVSSRLPAVREQGLEADLVLRRRVEVRTAQQAGVLFGARRGVEVAPLVRRDAEFLRENGFFECFPYDCPEPVLAK